jgi:death-on-curing protein
VVEAIHFDLVRTHGGLRGLRDENALDSALARPRNRWVYGRTRDFAALAASYGYALARNRSFRDGNKRVAFVVMAVFLELNGHEIEATEAEVVTLMLNLAAGDVPESALDAWLRAHVVPPLKKRSSRG